MLNSLLANHRFAAITFGADSLRWVWQSQDAAGLEDARYVSLGMVDLMRATHHLGRGFGRVAAGLVSELSADASPSEQQFLKEHRAALLDLILKSSGDGSFDAQVEVDPTASTVSVVASASTLDEVLPMAWIGNATIGLVGWFMFAGGG